MAPASLGEADRKALEKAAREMLETKQQLVDQLSRNLTNYCDTLLDVVMNERKLIDLINAYAEYIDERVLWIRSSRPLAIARAL